jgi:D-3-phosphoglycerate dehydrogenase / 2-oxoglutarate reductase
MALALLTDSDRFPFGPADLHRLAAAGVRLAEVAGHERADVAAAAADADAIFVYSARLDAGLIGTLNRCQVIARCGTGYDNIDVPAALAHGITVTYVPAYGAEDVAEHTIALILACARRIAASDRAVQSGAWPSFAELGAMRRLAGRTVGLIGFGRIGRAVAVRAEGLGLRVIAHDPYLHGDAAQTVRLGSLADVLEAADFVSVHVPFESATRHLLDGAALARMRPGSYLINTSRGGVVDQAALVRALDAGQLAGAALDVLEREPPLAEAGILHRPDVLITPHSAAWTAEALDELRSTALSDVLLVLRGERPRFPVPAAAG